jgi:hypothetical protein
MSEFILYSAVNSSFLSEQDTITRYFIQMFQSTSRTAKRISLALMKQLSIGLVF